MINNPSKDKDRQKKENLATFGVEDLDTIKIEKSNPNVIRITKDNIEEYEPLETPTFFSIQRDFPMNDKSLYGDVPSGKIKDL